MFHQFMHEMMLHRKVRVFSVLLNIPKKMKEHPFDFGTT